MTCHLFSKLFDVDDKKWPVWNRFFVRLGVKAFRIHYIETFKKSESDEKNGCDLPHRKSFSSVKSRTRYGESASGR